jgi:hypothetical protein
VASRLHSSFQGNKLLEEATYLDARYSNFNHVSGDQTIIENTVVVAEKVVVVEKVAEKVVVVEKVVFVERPRSLYEAVGRYAVVICCTVLVYRQLCSCF